MGSRPSRGVRGVYLPVLVPFVAGPLTECGHCIRIYLQYLLVVPGVLLGMPYFGDQVLGIVIAGTASVGLLVAATAAIRTLPRGALIFLGTLLFVALALEAIGFSVALRA